MNILIAGDYSPRGDLQTAIDNKNYSSVFDDFKPCISETDYSIINFETTIPDVDSEPIQKCGPHLKTTENAVAALKYAGFDCVTLANNHFRDYGDSGVGHTLDCLSQYGLDYVGAGKNAMEANRVLYVQRNKKKLAIINACEHEFSIAEEGRAGCNPIDEIQQFYSINEAKKNADYVVVIIHGGHEHFNLPSPRMKKLYRFYIDAGADAVINHHQHCYSGYEIYQGRPIFYGLGNFLFPSLQKHKKPGFWHYGYAVILKMRQGKVDFDIIPYIQCDRVATINVLKDKSGFTAELNNLNQIIADKVLLEKKVNEFFSYGQRKTRFLWEGYQNKIAKALYYLHILPSLVTSRGRKLTMFYNCLTCESHRDKMMFVLKQCVYAKKKTT